MAIRPSGSFRRYLLAGFRPTAGDESLYERLLDHRFRSIDDQPVATPSVGWVKSGSFSSTDFRPETVSFGQTLLLRMRVDKKRLPANAVRVRLQQAVSDLGGKTAKSARDALRGEIEKELLARTVPTTAVFDVYWRPAEETLLFSSTAAAAHDQFTTLFRETFNVTLLAATPTPLGEHAAGPTVNRERLLRLAELDVAGGAS